MILLPNSHIYKLVAVEKWAAMISDGSYDTAKNKARISQFSPQEWTGTGMLTKM